VQEILIGDQGSETGKRRQPVKGKLQSQLHCGRLEFNSLGNSKTSVKYHCFRVNPNRGQSLVKGCCRGALGINFMALPALLGK